MTKYVYAFEEGKKEMRDLLGGKGANLAEMTNIGLPVPKGFTVTTEACIKYYDDNKVISDEIVNEIFENIEKLESKTGKRLGDINNPLLISVRSGARASMPGMMDTVLNLGLNDEVVEGLVKLTDNKRFAYDSYRRFIQMFADVVMGLPKGSFERLLDEIKKENCISNDMDLTADDMQKIAFKFKTVYKDLAGDDFPQDPKTQLMEAIKAVFRSWNNERAITYRRLNDISGKFGTAVNIQEMVYGNRGEDCGTGVAFTRNPSTGENKLYGEYLINAQGEDVVAGIRTPQPIDTLKEIMPEIYDEFERYAKMLENHYKDMQDMEFTIENGKLYMLQTRNGKRTAGAAIKIAVDLVNEGMVSKEEALLKVEPRQLDHLLHPNFDAEALAQATPITQGLAASPGATFGKIFFSADDVLEAKEKGGKNILLVRLETSAEDIEGMNNANGILTIRGGMTSHAAVVARGMGKCCISGCGDLKIDDEAKTLTTKDGKIFRAGDYLSLDGTTGYVYAGSINTVAPEISGDFETFMSWTDNVRTLNVRANADSPTDAKQALLFGAEGIGLCRTEHMFFQEDRIFAMRQMITATTEEQRIVALNKLLPMQRSDFKELFKAMKGFPVTIRYLDPPLHEFLPTTEDEIKALAESLEITYEALKERVSSLHEVNPMMGHRGCRLSITYSEIARMQTRAVIEAAIGVNKEGLEVAPEIMIPLVGDIKELQYIKDIVNETATTIIKETSNNLKYYVGTMIEVPRAALLADEIAREADFFSFGTNDLTQMTYGFSRDDATKFLDDYYKKGILEFDPFAKLDQAGVGELVKMAVTKGQRVKPDIKLGICGEHGGDPSTVEFCHNIGLSYVSCSPYRVPIAKLAAAQAKIKESIN
ncbi:MAG: pyruvate, phosphate dikinase [Bacilli bacterium]|nr:pyruvate, phosphate dikinase [Bacilli bacterium]MDD4053471.1 pyruvate, phosphate dikinase [Bacilli bacterium]MDD4411759.1 pyruvate, phosphate dikinase [Bacilli bacterium]